MTPPLIIAHYIQTQRFIRVHLTFRDVPDKIHHHYIIPYFKKPQHFPPEIKVGTELIIAPKNQKHIFRKEEREIPKILQSIQPHILLCSNTPPQHILNYCKSHHIITVYIRHGIANKFSIPRIVKTTPRSHHFHHFDHYITHSSEAHQYHKMGIPPRKIHHIEGSPMIDYLRQITPQLPTLKQQYLSHINPQNGQFQTSPPTSSSLTKNTKTILLLQNHQGLCQYNYANHKRHEATHEYYQILNFLNDYAKRQNERIHIFTKLKGNGGDTVKIIKAKKDPGPKIERLHQYSPYITLIFWDAEIPMYHFLFADAVIVEACGTSLPESLLVNPHTIQCQILSHNDYYNVDRYPLLPQADNFKQLESYLNSFLFPSKYPDPTKINPKEFQHQTKEFIAQFYGKTTNVTPQIMNILKQIKKP